jgi:threonine dehydrogenase-like Zn-dependent dehydrogenase
MRALTWHGRRDVRVETVPDPSIEEPTDAIVKITSTGLCGSDLHLYEVLGPHLRPGDILGHEPMGEVVEVGSQVQTLAVGDRVVVPFGICCGECWMCSRGLTSQCERTQVREFGKGAALFGYTELYGAVPGGQAEYLRVPFADVGPVVVRRDAPDEQYLYLSDVLPTAWQAIEYADLTPGDTVAVLGLGPIGQMACRIALHRGASRVIGVDRVPARLTMAAKHGVEPVDFSTVDDMVQHLADLTDGRGPDAVVEAVGMEAHGAPLTAALQVVASALPRPLAKAALDRAGLDRLDALHTAVRGVRRGGTVSISGVYGGMLDPMPMMEMFDRQITLRMGQANVLRWMPDLLPLVDDPADPLDVLGLATHRLPLKDAPKAYQMFQAKDDDCVKVVFQP